MKDVGTYGFALSVFCFVLYTMKASVVLCPRLFLIGLLKLIRIEVYGYYSNLVCSSGVPLFVVVPGEMSRSHSAVILFVTRLPYSS